jgi:5-methylcytosine-specific restriction endonuclease McrA
MENLTIEQKFLIFKNKRKYDTTYMDFKKWKVLNEINVCNKSKKVYFYFEKFISENKQLTNEYILELSLKQSKGDKRRAKIKQKRSLNKEIRETKNYVSYESFYKTEKWIKISKIIKKFYGLRCMKCRTERGEMHADHIYPRSHYPSIEFELYNLQVLCKKCNMEKGNKECIDYRSDEEISRFNKRFIKHT